MKASTAIIGYNLSFIPAIVIKVNHLICSHYSHPDRFSFYGDEEEHQSISSLAEEGKLNRQE